MPWDMQEGRGQKASTSHQDDSRKLHTASWAGSGAVTGQEPPRVCLCLLPRPARESETTGHRQTPASFVQAFCLVHFCRHLGVPGGWATRASRVPGGTQDPEQSCSLLGPPGISNIRALGGSSCSDGLCLSSDGLWPLAPVWRDSHEVLSLREGTAGVSLVRWSPAVSACDRVSVCLCVCLYPQPLVPSLGFE